MTLRNLLIAVLMASNLCFVDWISAADEERHEQNAALRYWKAIAMLPELDKDERELLSLDSKTPLNEQVKKIVSAGEVALELMTEATEMSECDWGHDLDKGFELLLPHLVKSRELARLSSLRMRMSLSDGNDDAAIRDMVTILKLASHMGRDEFMVSMMVEYALRRIAVESMASNLSGLTRDGRTKLLKALKNAPAPSPIASSIAMEKALSIENLLRAAKSGRLYEMLHRNLFIDERIDQDNLSNVREIFKDLDAVRQMLDQLNTDYDRIAHDMSLPGEESMRKLIALNDELETRVNRVRENPTNNADDILVSMLLPASPAAKKAELAIVAREAMLRAAIQYANDDDPTVVDPFDGTRFEIKAIDGMPGWIKITSSFVDRNGEPVSLQAMVE